MADQSRSVVRFTLDGTRYELSRGEVEARLAEATPETIYTHGVRVNEIWFPVLQAFELAIGCARASFNSHTARRHLTALGFDVSGEIAARTDPLGAKESELQAPRSGSLRPTFKLQACRFCPAPGGASSRPPTRPARNEESMSSPTVKARR